VDVLTCHTPLTTETRAMINDKTLGLMKRGAIFVNTSRGPCRTSARCSRRWPPDSSPRAASNVFEEEPTPLDNPILNLPNVIVSPHAAGVTREANRQTAVQVAGEMLRVLRGERPDVLVNPDVAARLGLR
jgi:D-3-phosphoglycerate dehydrogenase